MNSINNITVDEKNVYMSKKSLIVVETTDDQQCVCETTDDQQGVCVCETTDDHDAHVAKMIDLSSRGINTLSVVFDKSSNTLTYKSWEDLEPLDSMNKAMEFRGILEEHADKDTQYRMV